MFDCCFGRTRVVQFENPMYNGGPATPPTGRAVPPAERAILPTGGAVPNVYQTLAAVQGDGEVVLPVDLDEIDLTFDEDVVLGQAPLPGTVPSGVSDSSSFTEEENLPATSAPPPNFKRPRTNNALLARQAQDERDAQFRRDLGLAIDEAGRSEDELSVVETESDVSSLVGEDELEGPDLPDNSPETSRTSTAVKEMLRKHAQELVAGLGLNRTAAPAPERALATSKPSSLTQAYHSAALGSPMAAAQVQSQSSQELVFKGPKRFTPTKSGASSPGGTSRPTSTSPDRQFGVPLDLPPTVETPAQRDARLSESLGFDPAELGQV